MTRQFKKQKGSLSVLFLAFVFCVIGFMSLGFVVGGRVNQNLRNQFAADESALAMASQASQGLNMIAANNLAVGSSLQIHNSVLVVGYYIGIFYAANYSLLRVAEDVAKEVFLNKANNIQTVVFDNLQVYGGAMISAAAGLTQYNNLLLDNWLYTVPGKGIEFGVLNAPGAFVLPFQQENQSRGDLTKSEQPFGNWSYDDGNHKNMMVTSPQQTLCMVTGVKLRNGVVTTSNGERYDENSATVFMFGPNHSGSQDSAIGKVLGVLEKTVSFAKAILDVTGFEFGFMPCGTATRGSMYQMIQKSSDLADRIIEMGPEHLSQPAKKVARVATKVAFAVMSLKDTLTGGFDDFGNDCMSPPFKGLGTPHGPIGVDFSFVKDKIMGVIANVVSLDHPEDIRMSVYLKSMFNEGSKQKASNPVEEAVDDASESGRKSLSKLFPGSSKNCASDAINTAQVAPALKISYSKKKAEECAIDPATGQYPKDCYIEFVLTEHTHLCPMVPHVKPVLGANCTFSESAGFDRLGFERFVPVSKDCTDKFNNKLSDMCKSYNDWAEAGANGSPDNGNMIVDLGCQVDSFLQGKPMCKSPDHGASLTDAPFNKTGVPSAVRRQENAHGTKHKDMLLGFLVIKKQASGGSSRLTPSQIMDRRLQFMSLVATPWLTNKETKAVFSDCSTYTEVSLKDPNVKRCSVASQALLATWLNDVSVDTPRQVQSSTSVVAGQATPTPVPTLSAQSISQLNSQAQVLSGGLKLEDPPTNETESLKIFKRMTLTLSKARVVHWPSAEDPKFSIANENMRTMWPAWTAVQADAGLSNILGASSQSGGMVDFLDRMAGRRN